jgi:hypothetical protein
MKNKSRMEVINKRHKLKNKSQRLSACQKKRLKAIKRNSKNKNKS